MTTPRVVLIVLILGTILCWFMASKAHATIWQVPTSQACSTEDDMARTLEAMGVVQIMGGTSGSKGDNMGEVWVNPDTKEWFFVQRIPDAHIACVVLGGDQMTGKRRRT